MALKRRDLLLGSAGMAAGLAAGSLASGPSLRSSSAVSDQVAS